MPVMSGTGLPPLEQLAWTLAKNHFDTSVPDHLTYERDPEQAASRRVFRDGRVSGPPERTILIVGAGASTGTFGSDAFPGTETAKERVNRRLGLSSKPLADIRALVETRKLHIAQAYGYDEALNDFETHLALVSDIFSHDRVCSILAEIYGKSFRPQLVFELIAHMLKHRFIDVVINFNFDELLDQAIAGEMGSGQYHRIFSDGASGELWHYLVGDRLKIPLYIKPHGTATQPTTMRFTKDQYHRLPDSLRKLMGDVIAGHRVKRDEDRTRPDYRPYPVNLITLGFGMRSLDLNGLISAAARAGTRFTLYHIDLKEKQADFEAAARHAGWNFPQKFIAIEDHPDDDATAGSGTLTTTMNALWGEIHGHFHRNFRPRGVARHRIVHAIFHSPAGDGTGQRVPRDRGAYFQARLYVELALALARGNGQIDLSAQAVTRVGIYFRLMWISGRELAMHDVLRPFTRGGRVSLGEPVGTIFRIPWSTVRDAGEANQELARDLWGYLARALSGIRDAAFQRHFRTLRGTAGDAMVGLFKKLASSDAKDIDPNFQPSSLLLSRAPSRDQVLHTSLGLTFRFVEMLNQEWDLMLVVSEFGKVVEKYLRHHDDGNVNHPRRAKRFCIVVGENERPPISAARIAQLEGQLIGYGDQVLFRRPPHVQTNYMVLLMKRSEAGSLDPVSGISYRKSGIHNRVNPIYLERKPDYDGSRPDDLDDALECFKSYVHESIRQMPGSAQVTREHVWDLIMATASARAGGGGEGEKISLHGLEIAGSRGTEPIPR